MPSSASGPGFRAAAITEIPCAFSKRAVASPIPEFPPIINIVRDMPESGARSKEVKSRKFLVPEAAFLPPDPRLILRIVALEMVDAGKSLDKQTQRPDRSIPAFHATSL
jgi:hypothetical protein